MEIGKKIRQLRIQNGLTLEELADRSELTKGFLSQLERDLATPSIATLQDIVEALGSDMSSFFQENKVGQIVFQTTDYFVKEQEKHDITWIVPNAQKNQMEPILVEFQPEGESQKMNPFEGEEFGYVLQGSVTLVREDTEEEWIVKKGETFYLHGTFPHWIKNHTKVIAKVLWITTPPIF